MAKIKKKQNLKEKIKKHNKSFDSHLAKGIFFSIALLALFGFGVYWNKQLQKENIQFNFNALHKTNWSVYENKDYNFEIKYTDNLKIKEVPSSEQEEGKIIEIEIQ